MFVEIMMNRALRKLISELSQWYLSIRLESCQTPGDEIMSEDRNSGISKAMFVGGLIIAVLVSGFVSIPIAVQL
jgi:hypothetical protein